MAEFKNCNIEFPKKPPVPVEKPIFKPGEKPQEPDKYSLWGSHDPAIFMILYLVIIIPIAQGNC